MQLATGNPASTFMPMAQDSGNQDPQNFPYEQYKLIRRNGAVVAFEPSKIMVALTKAFIAVNGGQGAASARVREIVAQLTENVVNALVRRQPHGGTFHIEDVQDQVELGLMRSGHHEVARAYVLYRERRAQGTNDLSEILLIPCDHCEETPSYLVHVKRKLGRRWCV